jgi:DNA-binding transcriptional MerR regulator
LADTENQLTIEQLAQETGMSVRNIRNHQSRGLLPPPEVRSRIGYYGPEHVARLRLVQEMQAEGFNLAAIARLVGGSRDAADRLVGFRRILTTPFETESPEILTLDELAERFGPIEPKLLERAVRLELLAPVGDGRYEAPSPALLRAAEEVLARGIPLGAALSMIGQVKRNCESVSHAFVKLFMEELWMPFEREGQPEERWGEVMESIERLRSLASEALLAMFKQTMAAEVEDAFGKALARQVKRGR